MIKFFRRFWKYVTAGTNQKFNEKADPKIQLKQAIDEAHEQHRRLKEHAGNVIAHQKQTELQLNRQLEELERLNRNARQAVKMADDAAKAGDAAKAASYTTSAEAIATQLVTVEASVESLKGTHYQATQAADQAKAAYAQNGKLLQKKLAEQKQLMSQLEQAKMQEQMNKAMASLSETVGEDVPSLDEVRDKIETRYAKAKGMSELGENSIESSLVEIEAASQNFEASARLDAIRSEMGIGTTPAEAPAVSTEKAPAPATEPPTEPQASPGV